MDEWMAETAWLEKNPSDAMKQATKRHALRLILDPSIIHLPTL